MPKHTILALDDFNSWHAHTYHLLNEIVENSNQPALCKPLQIFSRLLALVGERAVQLDDPIMNALMCQLTIYTVADPESPDYDPELVEQVYAEARKLREALKTKG